MSLTTNASEIDLRTAVIVDLKVQEPLICNIIDDAIWTVTAQYPPLDDDNLTRTNLIDAASASIDVAFHAGLNGTSWLHACEGVKKLLDRNIALVPGSNVVSLRPHAAAAAQREPMFKRIGELTASPREWLIKGFLARNEVGNPFGRPDSFKGVTAAQLCVHIAGGVSFLEMDVKQAPTAYFAAERGEQAKRRIKGHIQRLGLPADLPCYFGSRPINLLDDDDTEFLLEEVRRIRRETGAATVFLVVDTQSRTLPGNENSTQDGSKYAAAVESIRQAGATLWIISHIGHAIDAQDRPRGNSSLLAAYDTFYHHKTKDQTHGSIKITLDRDGLGQKEFDFVVKLFPTGLTNEDGEPVVTPFIVKDDAPKVILAGLSCKGTPIEPPKTTKGQKEALRALRQAIKDHGAAAPEDDALAVEAVGQDVSTVTMEEWSAEFYKLDRERAPDASRKAFSRTSVGLIDSGLVCSYANRVWPK